MLTLNKIIFTLAKKNIEIEAIKFKCEGNCDRWFDDRKELDLVNN
jgi:hypothetical protein